MIDEWDPDTPWCWADGEDDWRFEPPQDAWSLITAAAGAVPDLARHVSVRVAIAIDDESDEPAEPGEPEGYRSMHGDELVGLVSAWIPQLLALEPTSTVTDDDVSSAISASEIAAVVTTLWLDHAGPTDARASEVARWASATRRLHQELTHAMLLRIRPRRDGTFRIRLLGAERDLVRTGLQQILDALGSGDEALHRLFPVAYPDDDEKQEGWSALAHGELIESRQAAIQMVLDTIDQKSVTEAELHALMRCINDVRLVLGTRLDMDDHGQPQALPGPDHARMVAVYEHLGVLLYEVIQALRTTL